MKRLTGARVDPDVVRRRLQHLLDAVEVLREYQGLTPEELASTPKTYWAVEHGLQVCAQAVLDVASHLVAAMGAPVGEEYRDQLLRLGELGVVPPDFAHRLAPMAGFRNVLLHEYLAVDLREVHRVLSRHLDDFVRFASYVEAFLSRQQGG